MKRLMFVAAAALVALAALATAEAKKGPAPKFAVCHKTSSLLNPFTKVTVRGRTALRRHLRHGDVRPSGARCPAGERPPGTGGQLFATRMTGGTTEIPPGDPDGTGTAVFRLNAATQQVCFLLTVRNITLPTSASHIHVGPAGQAGNVVVPLTPAPGADGRSSGCVSAAADVIQRIVDSPAGHYVNVHTSDFPAGAVRGQLAG